MKALILILTLTLTALSLAGADIRISLNRQPVYALKVLAGKIPRDVAVAEVIVTSTTAQGVYTNEVKEFLAMNGYATMQRTLSVNTVAAAQERSRFQIGKSLFNQAGPFVQSGALVNYLKNGNPYVSVGLGIAALISAVLPKSARERPIPETDWLHAQDEWTIPPAGISKLILLKYDRTLKDAIVIRSSTGDSEVR